MPLPLSAFPASPCPPRPDELRLVLGAAAEAWEGLIAQVSTFQPPVAGVWACAGPKSGWSMRLKLKNRILLYLIPQEGQLLLGVVLGERAAKAAARSTLPPPVLALIDAAPRFAEGRGIRVPIQGLTDLATALALLQLKLLP